MNAADAGVVEAREHLRLALKPGEPGRILAGAGITDSEKGVNGDLHWHDLRHECGSRLAERGVPLHEIQYLMEHASLTTTQRYLNATVEALKKSVKVLEQQVG